MNTAPQDDFSGDLARDLGGWSDDALLKELSRRTTITTDADHELISTGAGLHLQHRQIADPDVLTVTYDPYAGFHGRWTIKVDGLRWTSQQNPFYPDDKSKTQGVAETKSWEFNDHNTDGHVATVYVGFKWDAGYGPYFPTPDKWKSDPWSYIFGLGAAHLHFFVEYDSGSDEAIEVSAADKVLYDGTFQSIARIKLYQSHATRGTYTIESDLKRPHVTLTPHNPANPTVLHWLEDTSELYCFNLGRGDIDSADEETSYVNPKLTIPADTEDIVQFGIIEGSSTPVMGLRGDSTIDWDEDEPLQLGEIKTDSFGNLVWLKSFTGRLHYRRPRNQQVAFATLGSKISDKEYNCTVYEGGWYDDAGVAQSGTATTIFIPQYAAGFTFAVGTAVLAIKKRDHWEGQPPVWLDA